MVKAGQITRLYPWVRARLSLEISICEHLLRDTRPDPVRRQELTERITHLQRVILEIDAPR